MTFLLDVNVLIALVDSDHLHHEAAHRWFEAEGQYSWASCPLTEHGVLRIVGDPRYPNSPGSPHVVAPLVRRLQDARGPGTYLLALAKSRNGTLITFDRHLVTAAVKEGKRHLHLLA